MVPLLLFAVLALIVVCLAGPSRLVRWMRQDTGRAPVPTMSLPPPAVPDPSSPDSDEELTEQILTAERLAGILSPQDYQQAMAAIAERDAVSHPMPTPPERL